MKKYIRQIILLLLASFSGLATYAQNENGFGAGINFGYNASGLYDHTQYGNVKYDLKFKAGPAYGLAVLYDFNRTYGVEIEGNYVTMGGDLQLNNNNVSTNENFTLHYIQIPVLFKIKGGYYETRFSTMIGPVFGYLMDANMHSDMSGDNNVRNDFRYPDFGFMLSSGGDITIAKNLYVNISLRVYYGLNTINSNPATITSAPGENENLGNAYIGLNLGLYNLFVKTLPELPVAPE